MDDRVECILSSSMSIKEERRYCKIMVFSFEDDDDDDVRSCWQLWKITRRKTNI